MPFIEFHDKQAANEFLRSRNSLHQLAILIPFAYKFMQERSGHDPVPFQSTVYLSEEQSASFLSFIAVTNAMVNRDADNKVMKRHEELGAVITPTLTWARTRGPIQREWKMYRPLEMAYDHPEVVDLLREHILNHGYINHEFLNEVMDTPMTMARGVI